jgi:hypothetical protein
MVVSQAGQILPAILAVLDSREAIMLAVVALTIDVGCSDILYLPASREDSDRCGDCEGRLGSERVTYGGRGLAVFVNCA